MNKKHKVLDKVRLIVKQRHCDPPKVQYILLSEQQRW